MNTIRIAWFLLFAVVGAICVRLSVSLPQPYQRHFAEPELGVYLDGFYEPETNGVKQWRWSKPDALINLPVFGSVGSVMYSFEAFVPNQQTIPVTITTNWHDQPVYFNINDIQPRTYHIFMPHNAQNYDQPQLLIKSVSFTPANDLRQIGIGFTHLTITPLTQSPYALTLYCGYVVLITLLFGLILFFLYQPLIWIINALLFGLLFTSPMIIQQVLGYQWILLFVFGIGFVALKSFDKGLNQIHQKLKHRIGLNNSIKLKSSVSIIGSILLYIAIRSIQAYPSLMWMNMYHFEDFPNTQAMIRFYANLQTGIPPVLSLLELIGYTLTGSTQFAHVTLLHIGVIATWLTIVWFPQRSGIRMLIGSVVGFIFLASVVRVGVHVYDPLFACCVLLAIASFGRALNSTGRRQFWLLLGVGFALSMAELLRPFGLIIIAACVVIMLIVGWKRHFPRRLLIPFFAPLVLFSGTWHLWLLVNHGQVTWSNNSGFNLVRSWRMTPRPRLIDEVNNQPTAPGRWENWNTTEHTINSNRLTKAVAVYIVTHPVDSMTHTFYRLHDTLWVVPTKKYSNDPQSAWFVVYRPLARIAGMIWLLIIGTEILHWRKKATWQRYLNRPIRTLVLISGTLTILILALGEAGEESRFLASILPFLALFPFREENDQADVEQTTV